jgi:hypothetical protein
VVWGQQAERDTGARVYVRVTPHLHRQPIGTAPDRGREIGAHDHLHAGRRVRGTVASAGRQCVETWARSGERVGHWQRGCAHSGPPATTGYRRCPARRCGRTARRS